MISLKDILTEIEFKTPEEFKKYKAKHKMRPGTVVKVAGKDKVVGDDKPKGKKTKSKPMPQPSDFGGDMDKYTAALNKRMKDDEKPKGKKPKGDEKSSSDKPDIDPKIDKQMSSAADKANMKMDRDEINGILKKKDEPFADEVEEILYDKFKKMGSTGKKLKQKLDTIASYEMGIYDMSEKEYNQERKEVKKELDDYYKKQGLDENLKQLSKITTRYNK